MRTLNYILAVILLVSVGVSCKKEKNDPGTIEIISCMAGDQILSASPGNTNVAVASDFIIRFNVAADSISVKNNILLKNADNQVITSIYFSFSDNYKTVTVKNYQNLNVNSTYTLYVNKLLKGSNGETFEAKIYPFTTESGLFTLKSVLLNNKDFSGTIHPSNVAVEDIKLKLEFSEVIDTTDFLTKFTLGGKSDFSVVLSNNNKTVELNNLSDIEGYSKVFFNVSSNLKSKTGFKFGGFNNWFITAIDSSLKFPLISDDELLTLIQQQTFKYFYDYAHPVSGLARERFGSGDVVTSGGSGFGIGALVVGMHRGFISRSEGVNRMQKIVGFLETADRFHGAWSHWINGSSGDVIPFSTKDNGGDLVETAFLVQGLLTMRQYLDASNAAEADLIARITELYNTVEWDWYTRGGQNTLYWHWSPEYNWDMNFKLAGYNETLITYILAAASPTHTISASAYHQGYARSGAIKNGKAFYGYTLPVGFDYGGPLFFAHYSFIGLDPRNLSDSYANYWTQNVNHSLINWKHCALNPKKYPNYNEFCWGLTASDIPSGYGVSEPTNDRGVITPTAAVSSLPYTPEQSMNAIRYFYYIVGDRLWGPYGFYDAFSVSQSWWASSYLAIDQGPEICMIENYRSGLLWDLFMSAPEIQSGLNKLGYSYK